MKKIFLKAFSLVELMVTLVVVSILTAAMAPMITKKLKSKDITISQGGGGLTMNCASISPQCGLCEGGVCVSCAKSCTENEALDIPNCDCKACNLADFHGEACLRCDMENCSKCTEGYYLASGNCTLCTDGYSCDGTNQNPCPAGYYCKDGVTTACTAGTYNDTTGATNESACVACSTKTENCTNCEIATGICNTCASGYDLSGEECKSKNFTYTYTGSATKTTMTDYTRIVLTTSGNFTANSSVSGEIFVLGGGGGGGPCHYAHPTFTGFCGCSGYHVVSEFDFIAGTSWSVTIGAGGAASSSGTTAGMSVRGGTGGKSSFGSLVANGGTGGSGRSGGDSDVNPCVGGSAKTFAGITYASGCNAGANTGTGGKGGAGTTSDVWGTSYGNPGGAGAAGVVVIMIPK